MMFIKKIKTIGMICALAFSSLIFSTNNANAVALSMIGGGPVGLIVVTSIMGGLAVTGLSTAAVGYAVDGSTCFNGPGTYGCPENTEGRVRQLLTSLGYVSAFLGIVFLDNENFSLQFSPIKEGQTKKIFNSPDGNKKIDIYNAEIDEVNAIAESTYGQTVKQVVEELAKRKKIKTSDVVKMTNDNFMRNLKKGEVSSETVEVIKVIQAQIKSKN